MHVVVLHALFIVVLCCCSLYSVSGALLGVLALFSGFFSEMVAIIIIVPIYVWWRARQKVQKLPIVLLLYPVAVY